MKKMTFNEFCARICDGMYTYGISDENQCTGYLLLRKMVTEKITPASKEEYERWRYNPTPQELYSVPDLKYLQFLHENLRPFIISYWDKIKDLEVEFNYH